MRLEVLRAAGAEQPLLLEVKVDGGQLVEVELVLLVLGGHQAVGHQGGERGGGGGGAAALCAGCGAQAGPGDFLVGHQVSSHLE